MALLCDSCGLMAKLVRNMFQEQCRNVTYIKVTFYYYTEPLFFNKLSHKILSGSHVTFRVSPIKSRTLGEKGGRQEGGGGGGEGG